VAEMIAINDKLPLKVQEKLNSTQIVFGLNSKPSGRVTLATRYQALASSRCAMGLGLVDGFQKIIGSRQD
jgi:hypothetical protein